MNKSSLTTFLVIIIIIFMASYFAYQVTHRGESVENSEAARVLVGEKNETAQFTDLDGNPISLKDFEGKIRVVNSWATWCPFCSDELKDFEKLASEIQREDMVFIAINRGEPVSKVRSYLARLGDFNHVIFVQDKADHFYKNAGGFAMPETIFYSQTGENVIHKRGFMSYEEMKQKVESLNADD